MPTLTIVAGPNGSGKTTLTKWVREEFQDNPVLDPDAIANSLQTTGATKGSAIDAGREVLLRAERLIADGQSLTVETTLSGHTYLRMMTKAKLFGYFVVLIYVATRDVEINIERVRNRVILGGHDVPEGDQRRRYPRSLANAAKAFAIADEGVILDNSGAYYVKLAVKRADGIQIYEPLPEWAVFLRGWDDPQKPLISSDVIATLPDILPASPGLKVLFVAKTPVPESVSAGHYFQGRMGKQFWNQLRQYDLLKCTTEFEDDSLLANGYGITDIVKSPRGFGDEPTVTEYEIGAERILQLVSHYRPKIVVFVFKRVLDRILDLKFGITEKSRYGFNPSFDSYLGAKVFVFPLAGTPCTRDDTVSAMQALVNELHQID